jgi:transposase-like protein
MAGMNRVWFETLTFSRADSAQNQILLKELQERVARSEIRIVDVRRHQDVLVITFRTLQRDGPQPTH